MFHRAGKQLTVEMMAALEPEMLGSISAKKALKVFRTAAKKTPAYMDILKENNVHPAAIKTIDDFKNNVPLLDKDKTFTRFNTGIQKLFPCGRIKDLASIVSSSGYSGAFSYGLNSRREIEKEKDATDFMLNYIFDTDTKKTLLINSLPMGVKIRSSKVTIADTSVRPDITIGIIKTFANCYEQMILVGENSFVKKVLEDGAGQGVDWKKIKVHIILGEELLPENLRSYLAGILNINPDEASSRSIIGSSFGVAEIGLNIFYETKELIRIRRLLSGDKALREKLIERDADNIPALFHYNPLRIFVEELPKEDGMCDMVITDLNEDACIPLIRYNIKDEGTLIPFDRLKRALSSLNYSGYIPRVRLPIAAIFGRDKIITQEGIWIRPEFIKELLYKDRGVACRITGNFRLSNTRAGLRIEIQAKADMELNPDFENKIRELLLSGIQAKTEIIIYPYREFPCGVELNYEKKFKYI